MSVTHNADPQELEKFNQLAATWWDINGQSGPLHRINPTRLRYISERLGGLAGKKILDVGCGGGILSEALAAAGAEVTAIDMSEAAINVAKQHSQAAGLNINYQLSTAEQLAEERAGEFDAVTCLEMLEHVPDPASVISACAKLAKPNGDVVFSTINRTAKAWGLAVIGAEYLLGLIPKGTHDYAKFIQPAELESWARRSGLQLKDISGLHYNPLTKMARLGSNVDINYLMHTKASAV